MYKHTEGEDRAVVTLVVKTFIKQSICFVTNEAIYTFLFVLIAQVIVTLICHSFPDLLTRKHVVNILLAETPGFHRLEKKLS